MQKLLLFGLSLFVCGCQSPSTSRLQDRLERCESNNQRLHSLLPSQKKAQTKFGRASIPPVPGTLGKPINMSKLGQLVKKYKQIQKRIDRWKQSMFVVKTPRNKMTWYLSYRLNCPRVVDKPQVRFVPYVGVDRKKNASLRVKVLVCSKAWIGLRSWKLVTNGQQIAGSWAPHHIIREAQKDLVWEEADIPILPQPTPRMSTLDIFLRRMLLNPKRELILTGAQKDHRFVLKLNIKLIHNALKLYDAFQEQYHLPQTFGVSAQ